MKQSREIQLRFPGFVWLSMAILKKAARGG